jgi:hypothetical protein
MVSRGSRGIQLHQPSWIAEDAYNKFTRNVDAVELQAEKYAPWIGTARDHCRCLILKVTFEGDQFLQSCWVFECCRCSPCRFLHSGQRFINVQQHAMHIAAVQQEIYYQR